MQGVGFRALVRTHAIQLGIKGSVCNLPDGRVEIHAQGPREQLDALLERVQRAVGPDTIDHITTDYLQPTCYYDDFSIIYGSRAAKR